MRKFTVRRKPPRSPPPERRRRSPLTIRGSGRTSAGSPQRAQSSRSACCKQASMNQASKQLVRTAAAWERGATRSARTFVAPSGGLAIFLSSPSCGGSLAQSTSVEASRREGQKSPATQMSRAERVAGALAQVGAMRPPHGMARASTFSVAHVDAPRARVAKLSDPTVHHAPLWHDNEGVQVERVGRVAGLPGEWLARAERHLAEVRRTESAPVRHVQWLVRADSHASGVVGRGAVGHHYGERVGDPCIRTTVPRRGACTVCVVR